MKPFVLEERPPVHIDTRYLTPSARRRASKKRRKQVRERRKADRKELRDEWGF